MSSKYYYLIAGLQDVSLEDSKLSHTIADFKKVIYESLSVSDQKLVDLFFLKFDNLNVLRLLANKDAEIDTRGVYSYSELSEYIALLKEGGTVPPSEFPSYLSVFITNYFKESTVETMLPEDRLAAMYYAYAMESKNKFVSAWFELNLNINNILVALTARKFKWNIADYVVGHTDICEMLRTSNARDFGLTAELDYFESLAKLLDIADFVEREKKTDVLRWNWIEDAIFFNYFTIERLFAFLLKLEMIERWISLDKEKGSLLFRSMIDALKNEVKIPAEFR